MDIEQNAQIQLRLPDSNPHVQSDQISRVLKDLLPSLQLTYKQHQTMNGWNISSLLGWPIFRCELLVSGSVYFPTGMRRFQGDRNGTGRDGPRHAPGRTGRSWRTLGNSNVDLAKGTDGGPTKNGNPNVNGWFRCISPTEIVP